MDSELQKDNLSSDLTSTLSNLGAEKERFYLVIVRLHLKGNADTKDLLRCWGNVNLFLKYPPLFFFASFWQILQNILLPLKLYSGRHN